MIQNLLASDLILVLFSLLLGGLIGMFGERVRRERGDMFDRRD